MKHKYIDKTKLRDFSKNITLEHIIKDIQKYSIQNIAESDDYDEPIYYFAEALFEDYSLRRANYLSYIEKNMNARIMMELRKSALLRMSGKELEHFYQEHSTCETVEDIKNIRIKYMQMLNKDYIELDWQIYYSIKYCWGSLSKNLIIDFECYYKDGDINKMTTPDDYKLAFLSRLIPEDRAKRALNMI